MPLVSFVVPAKDVAPYVGPLVRDLLAQSLDDLEVIVVDDGSRDGTADVVDQVARGDRRVALHRSTGDGPSAARNEGLRLARGEFIAFVDADDRVSPRFLELLHESIDRTGSDIASCNARRLAGARTGASGLHLRACARPAHASHIRRLPDLVYDTTVWNKLIRRKLWDAAGLQFAEGRWVNDIYPSLRCHADAKQVDVLTDVLYYWRVREQGATSITDSKLTSPTARLKSLKDRAHAITVTRSMLATRVGDGDVLHRFDERVLTHDLWTYLPFFVEGDLTYRSRLMDTVRDYLTSFMVDPEDHSLGPYLRAVYGAVLEGDPDRMTQVLQRETHVRARVRRRHLVTEIHPASSPGVKRRLLASVGRRTDTAARLRSDIILTAVRMSPLTHGLAVRGSIRIRDGRTDVEGAWACNIRLHGRRTGALIDGPSRPIEPATDRHLHPLRRSGWRPFSLALDLRELQVYDAESRWQLDVGLQLDGVPIATEVKVAGSASRSLGIGIPLTPDYDVVPHPNRSGLALHREAATPRLARVVINEVEGLAAVLQFEEGTHLSDLTHVWLQQADGQRVNHQTVGDGPTVLRFEPAVIDQGRRSRWELWGRVKGSERRIRGTSELCTTRLVERGGLETVVRPTVRGRVVVESRDATPELWDLRGTSEEGYVAVLGPRLPEAFGKRPQLVAQDHWSNTSHTVRVETGARDWQALLPLAWLTGATAGLPAERRWALHIAQREGVVPIMLAPESRGKLPLTVGDANFGSVRITAGTASRPILWASPPTTS